MSYDRNQIKEFIGNVENDLAGFVGCEMKAARLIANISWQQDTGELNAGQATQLLDDAYSLMELVKKGRRYARWVRNPPAELEILVLARNENALDLR